MPAKRKTRAVAENGTRKKDGPTQHAKTNANKKIRSPEALLDELVASPTAHANNLPTLISIIAKGGQAPPTPSLLKSIAAHLVERQYDEWADNDRDASQDDGARAVYRKWLARQREAFIAASLRMLTMASLGENSAAADVEDAERTRSSLQVAALNSLMELTRSVNESNALGSFDHVLYERVLRAICQRGSGVTAEVVGNVVDVLCGRFADVHYVSCKVLAKIAAETVFSEREGKDSSEDEEDQHVAATNAYCLRTVYDILLNITDAVHLFDDEALSSWCGASEVGILAATNDGSTKRQRKRLKGAELSRDGDDKNAIKAVRGKWSSRKLRQRAVSDAWIEFLKSEVPFDCYRSLLTRLHNTIIPALVNPLLLSDFLTHALDRGGMDGMLALNGIFILVTQHGLEYPKFYERLYGLLHGDVFLSKHRVRFFQLADIFLASPMVPAYTAAAFAKKFARLGIRGSPATAIVAIAFIHNIVRRHPSCAQILNRPESMRPSGGSSNDITEVWRGIDVYDEDEQDPAESRALESSLWELSVFRNHADCTVSQYCTMLDKDMTNKVKTAEIDISEVLGTSYASLFDREVKRRLKAVPTTVYAGTRDGVPQRLFRIDDLENDTRSGAPFPGFKL